jgi:hypothetical protein
MNFIRAFAVVWMLICLSTGTWIAYLVNDNVSPYVWDVGPPDGASFIDPDPADQQSMVTANWAVKEIRRVCPATLQRMFDNPDGTPITTLDPTELSQSIEVGDKVVPRSFQLPPNLPEEVDYSVMVCSRCNLYQKTFAAPHCEATPKIRFHLNPPYRVRR